MARIRTIKPEFWTDDALSECSLSARLLFIGTWNFADDDGNLERSSKQIKAKIFPLDCIDVEPLLAELIKQQLIIEYELDGKKYLHIRTFKDHQIVNRPSKTKLPAYDESLRTHGVLTEYSLPEGKGREGNGAEGVSEKPAITKTEFAFIQTFKDREAELIDLFPDHDFKLERATCIANYRMQPLPVDPYVIIVKWFRRASKKPLVLTPQDYMQTAEDLRAKGLIE